MFTAACLAGACAEAATAAPVEGDYQCDECHGLLTLKRLNPTELHVWLGVGSGSCSGEALVNRKVRYAGGVLEAPHKQGQVQCFARIEFTDKGASVTDTCFTARDERNSTCTMLGTYTKRKQ
jgi:hypothetical protein